jgi:hypothetical protein
MPSALLLASHVKQSRFTIRSSLGAEHQGSATGAEQAHFRADGKADIPRKFFIAS